MFVTFMCVPATTYPASRHISSCDILFISIPSNMPHDASSRSRVLNSSPITATGSASSRRTPCFILPNSSSASGSYLIGSIIISSAPPFFAARAPPSVRTRADIKGISCLSPRFSGLGALSVPQSLFSVKSSSSFVTAQRLIAFSSPTDTNAFSSAAVNADSRTNGVSPSFFNCLS